MCSNQEIIEVKSNHLSETVAYHCVILNDGRKGKINDSDIGTSEKHRRMIADEGDGDSDGTHKEKHVNVVNLTMTTKAPQCFRDQSLPMRGYSGRDSFSHQFGAQEQANRPVFIEKPKSLSVEEGQCARFTCKVKGQPLPLVRWEKDGHQITTETAEMRNNEDVHSLEISHSALSDAGRYICVATNDIGDARSMASLTVQKGSGHTSKILPTEIKPSVSTRTQIRTYNLQPINQLYSNSKQSPQKKCVDIPSKPSVVFQQVEYSATCGDRVSMDCNVTGFPEPKVSWFRERELIEPSETVRISYRAGVSSLERLSVVTTDSGVYICQAENDHGSSSARCQLSIQRQSETMDDHTPQGLKHSFSENSDLKQQSGKILYESELNVLSENKDSGNHKILPNDDLPILSVRPTSKSEGFCQLQVIPSGNSTDAVGHNEYRQSAEKSSTSMPPSLDISNSTSTNSFLTETELKEESKDRSHSYEKTTDYDGGDDDAFERPSNDLNSNPIDDPPLIEDLQPENVNMLCGYEFHLIAKFCGKPTPEVKWYKGSELLIQDDRIQFETKPRFAKLTVKSAVPHDTGIYALVLSNEFGQDKQLSSVTIEDKPEPPVGPPAITSVLDNSLVLSWSGSSYDGGCPVLKYKVEISRNNSDVWECLTNDCQHTTYQVLNLVPNTEYAFRVSAANQHGFSIPGSSSDPIITNGVKKSIPFEDFPFLPRHVKLEKDRKFADFYAIGEVIGKGKFGSVYKCRDKSTDQLFAAKFIRMKASQGCEFRQEIEIMNDLHHPKLLLLWDAFESPREIILIMEHVSGGELMERIINDDYVLTERECIHFMRQICEGIVYMHSCNILHLDLKPENILCVTPNSNEIKIIDFGLARKFDPAKEFRIMFGTAEFVAPEVINYDAIGYKTDMWSVGVICYVLLSGLSPFLGDNDKETFVNVTKAQYDFDDESFDEISDDAKDFISKLLVKDSRKRLLSEECLQHQWMAQDVTYMRAKKLSTAKHKKFMARSKWQKTGHALMALRRMVGLQKLSSSNLDSFRSNTSSLSSQTDSHSLVSDPNEVMSEIDDSGFISSQAQSLDSKSTPVVSKDVEINQEAAGNKDTAEQKHDSDSDFKIPSHGKRTELLISNRDSSMESDLTVLGFSPDIKADVAVSGEVLKDVKMETLGGKDFEGNKEEKSNQVSDLINLPVVNDNGENKVEGMCRQLEDVCIAPTERKKIQLPARKQAVQQKVSLSTEENDTTIKKFEQSANQPPSQLKRKLFAGKSFDLQTASKLNDSFTRSTDQRRSLRVSEKLENARKMFDNSNSSAAVTQRRSVNLGSQAKTISSKPLEFKLGPKTISPGSEGKKAQVTLGQTTLNIKNAESSSVAARKLLVQQSTVQRNTKPKKAPTFVRKMKNLDVVEGNIAKFEVLIDGNPCPTISWLKDGKEIPVLSQKYKTEMNDSGKHSLIIVDCGEDDDAEYGCKAINSLGSITTKANLWVEPAGEVLDSNTLPKDQKQ